MSFEDSYILKTNANKFSNTSELQGDSSPVPHHVTLALWTHTHHLTPPSWGIFGADYLFRLPNRPDIQYLILEHSAEATEKQITSATTSVKSGF